MDIDSRHPFIVIEGSDASGKTTLTQRLSESLSRRLETSGVDLWRFPDRSTPVGRVIDGHLKKGWEIRKTHRPPSDPVDPSSEYISGMVQQSLQILNRFEVAGRLVETLKTKVVLSDRYWPSGYAYGVAEGLDGAYLRHLNAGLPQPDICILLDVDVPTVLNRLRERGTIREIFESKVEVISKVIEAYRSLWTTVLAEGPCLWAVVDGKLPQDQVLQNTSDLVTSLAHQFYAAQGYYRELQTMQLRKLVASTSRVEPTRLDAESRQGGLHAVRPEPDPTRNNAL